MSFNNSTPNNSKSGVVNCVLSLEDIGNSLSKVESGIFLITHTLDLKKSELLMLGSNTSLEAGEYGLGVKSKTKIRN